jgi:hypothetical protein
VLADTQSTKQQETNRACEDLLQPPFSNGGCAFGKNRYSDFYSTDDAILLTTPTSGDFGLDIRTRHQTTDDLMTTTRPQTPGDRRHNAQISAAEVPGLRYHSTPTLTTWPILQHEFLGPYGQVPRDLYSHIVAKPEHLSVKHTAEGSVWYTAERSFTLLALMLGAQLGDCNFAPPTQDAWDAFQGGMVT